MWSVSDPLIMLFYRASNPTLHIIEAQHYKYNTSCISLILILIQNIYLKQITGREHNLNGYTAGGRRSVAIVLTCSTFLWIRAHHLRYVVSRERVGDDCDICLVMPTNGKRDRIAKGKMLLYCVKL